jgi:hypothetical protein
MFAWLSSLFKTSLPAVEVEVKSIETAVITRIETSVPSLVSELDQVRVKFEAFRDAQIAEAAKLTDAIAANTAKRDAALALSQQAATLAASVVAIVPPPAPIVVPAAAPTAAPTAPAAVPVA